jgi:hypothetical protein
VFRSFQGEHLEVAEVQTPYCGPASPAAAVLDALDDASIGPFREQLPDVARADAELLRDSRLAATHAERLVVGITSEPEEERPLPHESARALRGVHDGTRARETHWRKSCRASSTDAGARRYRRQWIEPNRPSITTASRSMVMPRLPS